MEKKSLKEALEIKPKDEFVSGGSTNLQVDKSTKRQVSKPPKPKPVKVSFYWDPKTEGDLEELRLDLRRKYGKRLTRSQLAEGLVKSALKNEKVIENLI